VAALELPERRTRPRRLPLGLRSAATRQRSRHGSRIEVGRLSAHWAEGRTTKTKFLGGHTRHQRGYSDARFPQPWTVDEADSELERRCFIVRDADGQALAYVYFEGS
jgi:hypothetical protein